MYEARQNRERVSRTISSPMQKKLQNVETKFKFSNYIVQRIPVFRVEPSDNEYKSTDESDGHFINKDHSLNISIGYPDHALYYSEMKDGYIIRWELDDNYWTNVLFPKLKRQREGSADNPTFNDISQVGLKLEIPSKMLDELWPNLVYKETYSDHGALADTNTNSIKNRSEQVQKLVERLTTAKLINPNQEKKILSDYSDNNDGWLNKTWETINKHIDKLLNKEDIDKKMEVAKALISSESIEEEDELYEEEEEFLVEEEEEEERKLE